MGFVAALAAAVTATATVAGEQGVEMECTIARGCFSDLAATTGTAGVTVLLLLDPVADGLRGMASMSLVSLLLLPPQRSALLL